MNKLTAILIILVFSTSIFAQRGGGGQRGGGQHFGGPMEQNRRGMHQREPNFEEIRETMRFFRIVETKKRLDFPEETLVKVNDALDKFEEQKFTLMHRERQLQKDLQKKRLTEEEAASLVDEIIQTKNQIHQQDMALWEQMREELNREQFVTLFVFYTRFTHEVRQKLRMLERQGKNRRGN